MKVVGVTVLGLWINNGKKIVQSTIKSNSRVVLDSSRRLFSATVCSGLIETLNCPPIGCANTVVRSQARVWKKDSCVRKGTGNQNHSNHNRISLFIINCKYFYTHTFSAINSIRAHLHTLGGSEHMCADLASTPVEQLVVRRLLEYKSTTFRHPPPTTTSSPTTS